MSTDQRRHRKHSTWHTAGVQEIGTTDSSRVNAEKSGFGN